MSDVALYQPGQVSTSDAAAAGLIRWAEAAVSAHNLATSLCATTFVPTHFQGKPGDGTAAILLGAEVGLTPISALQAIYVISGKPAMYARTMVALVQAAGHEVWTEDETDKSVTVVGQRKGSTHEHRSTWTLDRAKIAGYTKNAKYQSDPQAMLWARAASDVCRRMAPDVLAGIANSVEELDEEPGKPVKVSRASATAKAPEAEVTAPVLITDAQSKKLHALVNELGMNRDEKLTYASDVTGREITTTGDLTKEEAARVIDHLESTPDDAPTAVKAPDDIATSKQLSALNAQIKRLGLDAPSYLGIATESAERDIAGSRDLTSAEAEAVLRRLDDMRAPTPDDAWAADEAES